MHTIGLDISQDKIDTAILENGTYKTAQFDNTQSGLKSMVEWFGECNIHNPHICMEATGSYYELAADYLSDHYRVSVENPFKIKKYGEVTLARTKTDKQDAKLIAKYCANMQPQEWQKPTKQQRRLQKLITLQNQLTAQSTACKNQMHASNDDFVKGIQKAVLQTLQQQIAVVKGEIKQLIMADEILSKKFSYLKTIDGIGETTAATILSFFCGRQFDNAKKYISFLGLSPSEKSSGSSVRGQGRLSKYGHRKAKSAFYMAALVAYRDKMYPDFIARLEQKGKPKKVIIIALMRKLATISYHIYTNETTFERNRYR
ncbi:MAG: IS110 family transposase [Neisseriaceae bacterium]|nr:IS110 family transposase [Neisseriaceae bacterium]